MAGRDLTQYLGRLLTERGYSFKSSAELEIVREIKEQVSIASLSVRALSLSLDLLSAQYAYVASDFEGEMARAKSDASMESFFTMPDGQIVTFADQAFRCAEPLFQPNLLVGFLFFFRKRPHLTCSFFGAY